jgi:hypothetical protein
MKKTTLLNFLYPHHFKRYTSLIVITLFAFLGGCLKTFAQDTYTLTVFDEILFYDGYATTVDAPVPEGVIRQSNSLYSKKLTDDQLAQFGNTLTMNVTIKASCDNYDRIGNINLALVPKNSVTYIPSEVQRIELGRYITPFMDKNEQPDRVPYSYDIDNVAQIFKDTQITSQFDLWIELELFGVPYAANQQIAGCDGRNDVFFGSLEFVSGTAANIEYANNFILPLSFKYELRDYTLEGTDELGETVRDIAFTLEEDLPNAAFYLITSSHGANSGGEEYVRRQHYVYLDETEVLNYKPGGLSCVPYSEYNTQGNCIYTNCNTGVPLADTNSAWNWNNWCPGDKIPIRVIQLGTLAAGEHHFKIDVPQAVFTGDQGMIPMSVYLQGYDMTLSAKNFNTTAFSLVPNPVENITTINSGDLEIKEVTVLSITGQVVLKTNTGQLDLTSFNSGLYIVKILFTNNQTAIQKLVKS